MIYWRRQRDFPVTHRSASTWYSNLLATPLLREGTPIGVIVIRRTEVKPFLTSRWLCWRLLPTQAVIAIENVRLFKEIQERNAELREALEHQTATPRCSALSAARRRTCSRSRRHRRERGASLWN